MSESTQPSRLAFTAKYTIPAVFVTTAAVWSVWHANHLLFSLPVSGLYILFIGKYCGQLFLPNESRRWRLLFGVIGALSIILSFLSLIYWIFAFNREVVTMTLVLFPILLSRAREEAEDMLVHVQNAFDTSSFLFTSSHLGTRLLAFIFLWGDGILFFILLNKHYSDTLISPWTIIGPNFFFAFCVLTAVLSWIVQKSKRASGNIALLSIHWLLMLSVALIIFYYGFGFDPYIHQAAERWIMDHGVILPKTPYYIGQYMLTLFLHTLTHLPIDSIDQSLVPIGAALLLPATIFFAFSKNDQEKSLAPAILFLTFIPLNFFTATTPNNLGILLATVLMFWMWYESAHRNRGTIVLGISLVVGVTVIHPFIGLPLGCIYLGSIQFGYIRNRGLRIFGSFAYTCALALVIPVAIKANAILNHQTMVISNPLHTLNQFFALFKAPYWYWFYAGSQTWQLLYLYRLLIIPCAVAIACVGIVLAIKKYHSQQLAWYIGTISGLLVSAFFLSTSITFPNVISYEQSAYALRMLALCLVFLFPFFILAIREVYLWARQGDWIQFSFAIITGALLLVSWYFTYPTRDPISHYTGFNVRDADIEAVHFIANRNAAGPAGYIVLSNQVVAAAALHEFGFVNYLPTPSGEQYFYSIPTGSPLYQYFRKMVYESPKRQWMEEAMRYAGVKKAYFVHTNYWAPAAQIRDEAKAEADAWWDIDQGRVWVYEYILK